MKKVIFGLVVASVFAACNGGSKTEEVKTDSTAVAVDTTKVVDSTVVTVDSTVAAPAKSVVPVK